VASASRLHIARIALGCGNFGGIGSAPEFFGQGLTGDQAFALMDAAWESGIRHFDTADAYGGGRSEQMIGSWIAATGVRPQITTKTFNAMSADGDYGLRPERIARQLRSSLDRLGVENVGIYLAHDFDRKVPLDETLGAFEEARAAGLVGAYGVSNFSAPQLERALAAGHPQAIQNSYSLLDRGDDPELLDLCQRQRVAYLAFSPLAGGWLTGKYRRGEPYPTGSRMTMRPEPYAALVSEPTFVWLDQFDDLATRRGTSMTALALAWLLADGRVDQIVVGPGSPAQLGPVAEALDHPLTGEEQAEIEAMGDPVHPAEG
jgi:aryl-alcohol dehydrogenase-like predicted oxidoreductase